MHADKTTLNDLSIFCYEEEQSVFHHIDLTRTVGGREWLKYYLGKPLATIKEINERQQILQRILNVQKKWPLNITNGTIMVLEKFYESPLGEIPHNPHVINALIYKMVNRPDYSLVEYSVDHFSEFVKGLNTINEILFNASNPPALQAILERIQMLLRKPEIQYLLRKENKLPVYEVLKKRVLFAACF